MEGVQGLAQEKQRAPMTCNKNNAWCVSIFFNIYLGAPLPPVINNKETEINGCDVNLTWSQPPRRQTCPITKYRIYYREKESQEKETEWSQIAISQVTRTFHVIRLTCDKKYEIAVSALNEITEGKKSTSWLVKVKTGVILFYDEDIIIPGVIN